MLFYIIEIADAKLLFTSDHKTSMAENNKSKLNRARNIPNINLDAEKLNCISNPPNAKYI